ncbi:aminotransferase class V-fold PLP-dependent enzyme [Streptomyces anulatus]|uniref:aminotransferase class V-fold PLP-dependent enzyme n=1 Tax=Streptomyces TaxID=1883 RepID=UPI00067D679C|nr:MULTISPECIES: aminotransferase class V-fold PLP-dependent enzyme [Streptomyces]KND37642.1 cysteine desulfurase [Streptomyces europaeiscabiei]KPL29298.1 cysteine desulfurase [Streptomyces anulatus]WSC64773.1 aminotransferase class V-fold PLP-dependent enzyme [Streptomyces anulatus]WSR79125.1 aminotransferase class V-fold PLP-dependent enzyme [Streptomyces anulatus]WTC62487.1 aminotransferase class V-fold PLP-dependent enzyme [Streptomyces anulatus]
MTVQSSCRDDFPALRRKIDGQTISYLDNGATTLKPRSVIDAVTEYYETNGANIHRGKHRLSEEASDAYEASRTVLARHIGAAANEVVLLRNTSEAINLVAGGLELPPDAYIVGCMDAHHSQILPWRRAGRLDLTRVDGYGRLDRDHFRELLRGRPQVVALTHCSNVTGVIHPVEELIEEVRAACDAVIVLDAAQSLPHERVNVHKLDVDFMAFSMHKMLGPTGVGCLFGRSELLAKLRPQNVGGGMVDWVDLDGSVDRRTPFKFESGTPAIASVIGCAAAIRYLEGLDADAQHQHGQDLCAALVGGAIDRPGVSLIGPPDVKDRIPLATLRLADGVPAGEVARLLSDSHGYMVRSGHMCAQPLVTELAGGEVLRVSAYVYNDVSEIEGFYGALDELLSWMAPAARTGAGRT